MIHLQIRHVARSNTKQDRECVYVRVFVCMCVCMCVRVSVHVHVFMCHDVPVCVY